MCLTTTESHICNRDAWGYCVNVDSFGKFEGIMKIDNVKALQAIRVIEAVANGRKVRYSVVPDAKFRVYNLNTLFTYDLDRISKFEIEEYDE